MYFVTANEFPLKDVLSTQVVNREITAQSIYSREAIRQLNGRSLSIKLIWLMILILVFFFESN